MLVGTDFGLITNNATDGHFILFSVNYPIHRYYMNVVMSRSCTCLKQSGQYTQILKSKFRHFEIFDTQTYILEQRYDRCE